MNTEPSIADTRMRVAVVRCIADELERALDVPNNRLHNGIKQQLADELEKLARALKVEETR
jgi:hypothetical protein